MTEEWIDISDPRRPNRDEVVQVKTVWNDDVSNIKFQGEVSTTWSEKGRYEGFGVLTDRAVKCWRSVARGEA